MTNLAVVAGSGSTALARLVDDYLGHCRAKGLAPKTIKGSYGYPLEEVFLPWCAAQQVAEPAELTNRVLDRFSAHLLDKGGRRGQLAKHTVWTYVKAVRLFIAWARKDGEQIPGEARLPKLPERLPDILSRAEIERMENRADNVRDQLIVRLLADTGIRVGELVGLRLADLIEQQRGAYFVRVNGKGSKQRLVPLTHPLYRRITRWRDKQRPDAVSDYLFVARLRDAKGEYRPLTYSGVEQMIRQLAERAGISKRVHPHLFRHSAATFLLSQGANAVIVARLLGHSNLEMIRRTYEHLTPMDVSSAVVEIFRKESAS